MRRYTRFLRSAFSSSSWIRQQTTYSAIRRSRMVFAPLISSHIFTLVSPLKIRAAGITTRFRRRGVRLPVFDCRFVIFTFLFLPSSPRARLSLVVRRLQYVAGVFIDFSASMAQILDDAHGFSAPHFQPLHVVITVLDKGFVITRRRRTSCWSQPRLARVVYRFDLWFIHVFLSGAAQRPR